MLVPSVSSSEVDVVAEVDAESEVDVRAEVNVEDINPTHMFNMKNGMHVVIVTNPYQFVLHCSLK